MGFFFSLVGIAAMTALGIYGYGRLRDMELQIRSDLEEGSKNKERPSEKEGGPGPRKAKVEKRAPEAPAGPIAAAAADVPASSPLEQEILEMVSRHPGMLQSDLYELFPGVDRRAMQKTLLDMDRQGKLRREKEKSTYRLFVGKK